MRGQSSMVSLMAASLTSVISLQPMPLWYALTQGGNALILLMASESLLCTSAERVALMSSTWPMVNMSRGLPGFSASAHVWSLVIRG